MANKGLRRSFAWGRSGVFRAAYHDMEARVGPLASDQNAMRAKHCLRHCHSQAYGTHQALRISCGTRGASCERA